MQSKLKKGDRVTDLGEPKWGSATVFAVRPSQYDDGREDIQVYWDSDRDAGMPLREARTSIIWWPAHMFQREELTT